MDSSKMINYIKFPKSYFKPRGQSKAQANEKIVKVFDVFTIQDLILHAAIYIKNFRAEDEAYLQLKFLIKCIVIINRIKHYKITLDTMTVYVGMGFCEPTPLNKHRSMCEYIFVQFNDGILFSVNDHVHKRFMSLASCDDQFINQFDECVHYYVSKDVSNYASVFKNDKPTCVQFTLDASNFKNLPFLISNPKGIYINAGQDHLGIRISRNRPVSMYDVIGKDSRLGIIECQGTILQQPPDNIPSMTFEEFCKIVNDQNKSNQPVQINEAVQSVEIHESVQLDEAVQSIETHESVQPFETHEDVQSIETHEAVQPDEIQSIPFNEVQSIQLDEAVKTRKVKNKQKKVDLRLSDEYKSICDIYDEIESVINSIEERVQKYKLETEELMRNEIRDHKQFIKLRKETSITSKRISLLMKSVKEKRLIIKADKCLVKEIMLKRGLLYKRFNEIKSQNKHAFQRVRMYRSGQNDVLNKTDERIDLELKIERTFKRAMKSSLKTICNSVSDIKHIDYKYVEDKLTESMKHILES